MPCQCKEADGTPRDLCLGTCKTITMKELDFKEFVEKNMHTILSGYLNRLDGYINELKDLVREAQMLGFEEGFKLALKIERGDF